MIFSVNCGIMNRCEAFFLPYPQCAVRTIGKLRRLSRSPGGKTAFLAIREDGTHYES